MSDAIFLPDDFTETLEIEAKLAGGTNAFIACYGCGVMAKMVIWFLPGHYIQKIRHAAGVLFSA
jgi:hypothetical protein